MFQMRLTSLLVSFICLSSCHDDNDVLSNELSTDSFIADFHVTNSGTNVSAVEAQFKDSSSSSFIDLKDGDHLLSSTLGPAEGITNNSNLFTSLSQTNENIKFMTGSSLNATFSSTLLTFSDEVLGALHEEIDINTSYTISLRRPAGINAPNSFVQLPTNFSITSPQSGAIYSRSTDNININWSNTDNSSNIKMTAALNCSSQFITEFVDNINTDTGSAIIPAGRLSGSGNNCTLRVILDRFKPGTIDSHYAPGSQIIGHQKRLIYINTVP